MAAVTGHFDVAVLPHVSMAALVILVPAAVLVASAPLVVELVVQIPFIGPSLLQAVFGTVAVVMAALALRARRLGGWVSAAAAPQGVSAS